MRLKDIAVIAGLGAGLLAGTAHSASIYTYDTPGFYNVTLRPGTYDTTATGGSGGSGYQGAIGGSGSTVFGTFTFAASEALTILVGGEGGNGITPGG